MSCDIHLGTCSWKYPGWAGTVYSVFAQPGDYLREYAGKYDTVEVDQWFWSLFGPGKLVLPQPKTVAEYAAAVPDGFRFGIKLPDALTLTHYRPKSKAESLVPNPHFLSLDLLHAVLERLEPMRGKLGPMMLQFGYLNRHMAPSQAAFLEQLGTFAEQLPAGYEWAVETRNPNHLNAAHFDFLRTHGLAPVFLQGYYMPPVADVYAKHADLLPDSLVIRLHGPDREGIEERAGADWSRIVEPRDADLEAITGVANHAAVRRKVTVYANNHFEGCAPLTLERLKARLAAPSDQHWKTKVE
jgi:uncharacterized protein YecE (DUF72 family)